MLAADNKVPDPKDPDIATYTTGKPRKYIEGMFVTRQHFKQRTYGKPVPHIKSVTAKSGKATVVDCVDTSKFGLLDKGGNKLTVGLPRVPITATLVEAPSGAWMVAETTTVEGGKC